jgi:hypothetical protein
VYEGDVDKLYRVAFAYEKIDEDEARKMRPPHRGPGHRYEYE